MSQTNILLIEQPQKEVDLLVELWANRLISKKEYDYEMSKLTERFELMLDENVDYEEELYKLVQNETN